MSQFLLFHIFVGENSNFMTHAGLSLNLLASGLFIYIHLVNIVPLRIRQWLMFAHQRVASWCAECWSFWSFIWTTNTLSYTLYLWNQTPNHNVEFKAVHNTHHEICSMLDFWGTRINWPIDCGPYNGGSPGEGGGSTSRTEDSELVVGQCGATNIGFDQRLFDQ